MAINYQDLLVRDVQTVFNGITSGNANDTLSKLKDMAEKVFQPFKLHHNQDLWIKDIWATGPQYGYKGFPDRDPGFPSSDNPQVAPLSITLDSEDRLREAFLYLFTRRRGHWNCSNRNGGYQVFGNAANRTEINQKFREISALDNNGAAQLSGNVEITRTVMMHLVWPYIFPTWYKETRDGYSQIRGMARLLSDVAYHSNDAIRIKNGIDLYFNYAHYASAYRILLLLYKMWISDQRGEPHFDFFTQFLADLIPTANPLNLLQTRKSLVLYGVPGTGKTHTAIDLANSVVQGGPEDNNVKKVQFHPGYSYADFIIGIRPVTTASGQVNYRTSKGVLYEWAEKAVTHQGESFCLIIDEINRANLAEVLGEAMYCLEYRGENKCIQLPQIIEGKKETEGEKDPFDGGKRFYLPDNLYVIGTMNHADRSISGFDMALRRRFAWYKMEPMTWVRGYLAGKKFDQTSLESFLDAADELNDRISAGWADPNDEATRIPLNADHQIGDSYFAAIEEIVFPSTYPESGGTPDTRRILPQHRETLWLYYIRPLLEDYLGNDIHSYQDALKRLGERFVGE